MIVLWNQLPQTDSEPVIAGTLPPSHFKPTTDVLTCRLLLYTVPAFILRAFIRGEKNKKTHTKKKHTHTHEYSVLRKTITDDNDDYDDDDDDECLSRLSLPLLSVLTPPLFPSSISSSLPHPLLPSLPSHFLPPPCFSPFSHTPGSSIIQVPPCSSVISVFFF